MSDIFSTFLSSESSLKRNIYKKKFIKQSNKIFLANGLRLSKEGNILKLPKLKINSRFSPNNKNKSFDDLNLVKGNEILIINEPPDENNNIFENQYLNNIDSQKGIKEINTDKIYKVVKRESISEYKIDLTGIKYNSQIEMKSKKGDSNKELSSGLFVILGNTNKKNSFVSFYDNEGTLRGEMPIINYRANKIMFRNDRLYMSISESKIAEINNLGQVTEIYSTGKYNLHHDYTFDDSGDLIILATERDSLTDEDIIIRLDLETKEIFKLIDFKDLLKEYYEKTSYSASSYHDGSETGYDWIHINSINYSEGNVYASSRETSSIFKIENIEKIPNLVSIIGNQEIWKNTPYFDLVYSKKGDFTVNVGQNNVGYKKESNGIFG